ncbi:pentatricopeptide repeat-containing protein At4g39530 [Phoenix dactylifera]|uniref:Pentatricopeptide repeat-containing protein At4g39530 n=1 Tax=Phoenix dactylifera TaxID=42345 RepID=A0A8B7C892_PHODC|nr:pentatricopeptide repeat-containing protein At4g39530 [Phoenix dactylifera]
MTFESTAVSAVASPLLRNSHVKRPQTIVHLLRSCISGQTPRLHLQPIHAQSIIAGLRSDLFVNNLLLNGYSKSGLLGHAQKVFEGMPERNMISWSSTISMYTQHCREEEALYLFSSFRRSSSESPNEFILASVLRACVQSGAVDHAAQVHGLAAKSGFDSDVFVGTALINFYTKIGSMDEAMSIFYELPVTNSVTWTAVITGYSQIGKSATSLRLFNQMKESGVPPDRFVLSTVVRACSALDFLDGGRQIHGYAYRSGTEMDVSINNVLIDLYCKCSKVRIARRLFDWMVVKNLVSWTTMIAGYMQNSSDLEAMDLFLEMIKLGWQPDGFACTSILSSCGSLMASNQGKQVHAYAIKAKLESDEYVSNGLVDMYAKCGYLVDARAVFDAMIEHNVISYNAMIEGYARHEELVEAIALFNGMRSGSPHPSLLTYVSLLGLSASLSAIDLSNQIHCLVIKAGVALDLYAGSALVDVYSKCLCTDDARAVFDEMDQRDLVVWNAMIFGYTQNAQGEEALKLFHQLCVAGMRPNEFTFVALVTVASNLASLFHGLQFHSQIIKAGLDFDPHVSNALIDMYAKCGCIEEAWVLFDSTHGRDVVCWNSMISRYAQHGHAEEALKVFQLMRHEEIEPSYVTFVGVLSACSHAGLTEEGLCHFHSMKDKYGIKPGMEHYASVVTLLGRAGKLQEAKEFIEQMPIEPAAVLWRSLLSACREFGNVDLGRYAAEMAILKDPKDSGPYVLLSNIFASRGMWADAEKVRKGMDYIGAVKEPGYSWIEVMKEVHVFIARGREHPKADLIYLVLDGLMQLIKVSAHEPETTELLMGDLNG